MRRKASRLLLFLFIFSWMALMNGCMTFRKTDKATLKHFQEKEIPLKIHHKDFKGKKVRYIETGLAGDQAHPLILFIHGAPGASDAYFDYLSDSLLCKKARLIAIDRMGYGYSQYGKSERSIDKQAQLVNFVLDQYPYSKAILVGHSYGGPVAARQAINFPDKTDAVVMVAPVNDPYSEKIFWFAYWGYWKLTRWTISKALRVATDEKFSHIDELKKLEPYWATIQQPVIHIHGTEDGLASFDNIAFSKKHIPDALLTTVELEGKGHMILWSETELIKNKLTDLLVGDGQD